MCCLVYALQLIEWSLVLNGVLPKEVVRDGSCHTAYQRVVEKLCSLHGKPVPVEFQVVDVEVFGED